jgi:hypothetical protein
MHQHRFMSTTRARLLLAASLGLGLMGITQTASADAAAGASRASICSLGVGPYGANGQAAVTLPSNAPALLLIDNTTPGLTATLSGELVTGTNRSALGTPAKDAHGVLSMTLPSSLAPGDHVLDMKMGCSNNTAQEPQEFKVPLVLTAPVAFPTAVGKLTHLPQNPPTGVDNVRLEASAGMFAFLPASIVELSVDGTISDQRSAYPSASSAPLVFSAHTGDVCIENGELHRDKRTVRITVSAVIAGVATSPEPATLDVPVDCGAIQWTSESDRNPKTDPPTKTTTPTPDGPTGSSSDVSTCSATPLRAVSSMTPIAGLGLVALLALRRRRRA